MGAQMWLALTEATRHGGSGFQHLGELPVAEVGEGEARVLIGSLGGASSPAEVDHPTIGADVTFRGSLEVPTEPGFEYGVVPIDQPLKVQDAIVEPGSLALVPTGFEALTFAARSGPARMLLLGGEPLGVELKMWWNFVARTLDEISEAWRAWRDHDDGWFGPVPSSLARIDAPTPPWLRAEPGS
jgi:redox-sensitive bicupin YhaK (pirin superfamily)